MLSSFNSYVKEGNAGLTLKKLLDFLNELDINIAPEEVKLIMGDDPWEHMTWKMFQDFFTPRIV